MGTVIIEYEGRVLTTVDEQAVDLSLSFDEDITSITRIVGLDRLVNIKELCLNGNKIERIEGLDKFMNLECLYLESNQIVKIEGLENLVHLKRLRLG